MKRRLSEIALVAGVFLVAAGQLACDNAAEMAEGSAGRAAQLKKGEAAMADEASDDDKVVRSDAEWRRILTPEQYRVMRLKGTEPVSTGKYNDFKGQGVFHCAGCGHPLFRSDTKYDSGSGWPSFRAAVSKEAVGEVPDTSLGMVRTEVTCSRCDAHLGHLFDDGPKPTGLRYCVNSVALKFVEGKGK